jgi:hypothetical protein
MNLDIPNQRVRIGDGATPATTLDVAGSISLSGSLLFGGLQTMSCRTDTVTVDSGSINYTIPDVSGYYILTFRKSSGSIGVHFGSGQYLVSDGLLIETVPASYGNYAATFVINNETPRTLTMGGVGVLTSGDLYTIRLIYFAF